MQSVSSEELDLFAELLIEDDDVKHDLTPSDTAESIAAQFLRDRSRLLLLKTFLMTSPPEKKNCVVDLGLFAETQMQFSIRSIWILDNFFMIVRVPSAAR